MGARKYIDCRLYESDVNCTVTIMADTEEELLSAAVEHAVAVHKHRDSPGLRDQLRRAIQTGAPPAEMTDHSAWLKPPV
jgi:predicted small metal-binding protein